VRRPRKLSRAATRTYAQGRKCTPHPRRWTWTSDRRFSSLPWNILRGTVPHLLAPTGSSRASAPTFRVARGSSPAPPATSAQHAAPAIPARQLSARAGLVSCATLYGFVWQ
jgi:hypothetical protein